MHYERKGSRACYELLTYSADRNRVQAGYFPCKLECLAPQIGSR
jgi:hypothetical protein